MTTASPRTAAIAAGISQAVAPNIPVKLTGVPRLSASEALASGECWMRPELVLRDPKAAGEKSRAIKRELTYNSF